MGTVVLGCLLTLAEVTVVLASPDGITEVTGPRRGRCRVNALVRAADAAGASPGFVSLSAKATYGDITSVTWHAASSGCSSPNSRLLWGDGYTVPNAPIVQANCFVRPSP